LDGSASAAVGHGGILPFVLRRLLGEDGRAG
jgi:hypothetical protein